MATKNIASNASQPIPHVTHSIGRASLEQAQVVLLGIPFDSTAIAEGNQRFGPTTIRQALQNCANHYVPELRKSLPRHIFDAGDVEVVHGSFSRTDRRIRAAINTIRDANPSAFLATLGGEHLVTLSLVRALRPRTIVSMDAHTDLWTEWRGEPFSHASWLHHAHRELGAEVATVGMRAWPEGFEDRRRRVASTKKLNRLKGPVYLSIDIDVFDPAYAPETGFPEPEGLTPTDVFHAIDEVFQNDVIGMDIVEVNSVRLNSVTSNLAARTLVRALSHLTDRRS